MLTNQNIRLVTKNYLHLHYTFTIWSVLYQTGRHGGLYQRQETLIFIGSLIMTFVLRVENKDNTSMELFKVVHVLVSQNFESYFFVLPHFSQE